MRSRPEHGRRTAEGSLLPWLALVAIGALGLALWLGRSDAPNVAPGDTLPDGRWYFQPDRLVGSGSAASDHEAARALSLPYLTGSQPAPEKTGVAPYVAGAAFEGVNLYVSGHAPEAYLMGMDGQLLHRWRQSFANAFPEQRPGVDTSYIRRAWLLDHGDLLALYQGGGMVRIDRDSHLVWRSDLAFFNHLFVTADGTIWSLVKAPVDRPEIRPGKKILEDSVVRLSLDGELLDRFSILETLRGSRFSSLLEPLPAHADILHANTVMPVSEAPPGDGILQPGDLLVSLREIDTIVVIEPETRTVKAAWRGPWTTTEPQSGCPAYSNSIPTGRRSSGSTPPPPSVPSTRPRREAASCCRTATS